MRSRWWKLSHKTPYPVLPVLLAVLLLGAAGCRQGLFNQARYEPYEASEFFEDGAAVRPLPPHTVARGHLRDDTALYTGMEDDGTFAAAFPMPVEEALVRRGRERYEIFCQPCHGGTGAGDGMIVERGYKQPQTFHQDRLRNLPAGYFVNVIAQGYGTMPPYASQVPPEDRWAIAAYIRALQASRAVPESELTPDQRAALRDAVAGATGAGDPHGASDTHGESHGGDHE